MGKYSKKPLVCEDCDKVHYRWGKHCGACYNRKLKQRSPNYRKSLDIYNAKRARLKRERNIKTKLCVVCEFPFETTRSRHARCSECASKLAQELQAKLKPRDCKICRNIFKPKRGYQFLCDNKRCKLKNAYLTRNIEKRRLYNRIREARERGAEGSYTIQEWINKKQEFDNACAFCGLPESKVKLEIDHIVPIQHSGTNYIDNLQPLCRKCNASKGAKILK